MKDIDKYIFKDKRVIIRVDYNIPMSEKLEIIDDIRIRESLPTINKVINDGGKVILLSHLGRPKGKYSEKYSLKHLVKHLNNIFQKEILFSENCIGDETLQLSQKMRNGDILLLENVRFHKEEIEGNNHFAEELANLGDVYINDAFATSHRNHASIVG